MLTYSILKKIHWKDDFFVGIGDINEPIYAASNAVKKFEASVSSNLDVASNNTLSDVANSNNSTNTQHLSTSTSSTPVNISDAELVDLERASAAGDSNSNGLGEPSPEINEKFLAQMEVVQRHVLDEQQKDRPLARRQSLSDSADDSEVGCVALDDDSRSSIGATIPATDTSEDALLMHTLHQQPQLPHHDSPPPLSAKKPRRPVLRDDDVELDHIGALLEDIHSTYYQRRARPGKGEADVRSIMPALKRKVLRGVCIVFSGVIPIGQDPEK